jgi:hypothetical protein
MTDELITLEVIEAKQTELASLIAKFKRQPAAGPVLHKFGEIEIELHPGERYAGMVLDQDGKLMHHLVLMAQRPDGKLEWQEAMEWATSVGGVLPNRQEQAMLYANCKPHLKPEWHWSSETHADDASSAWGCYFDDGNQNNLLKSYDGCAVAVRLIKPGETK